MDWEEYNNWFKQHYQREIKDFVSFIIHELKIDYTARILDIGSGPGWFSLELASRMPETEIISLEQNAELVTIANQNKIDTKITNINFVKHAPDELHTLSNRSFDCVTSFKVLKQWSFPDLYVDTALEHQSLNITSAHKATIFIVSTADLVEELIRLGALNADKNQLLAELIQHTELTENDIQYYKNSFMGDMQKDPLFLESRSLFGLRE